MTISQTSPRVSSFYKTSTFVLSTLLASVVAFTALPSANADEQPKMQTALSALRIAKVSLEAASTDKGGHRAKALQLTREAMEETQKGIAFDNEHQSKDEKKDKEVSRGTTFAALGSALFLACGGGQRPAQGPAGANQVNAANAEPEPGKTGEGRQLGERTQQWEKLGERVVDGKLDRDAVVVGRDEGRFSEMQLRVDGSALELYDVVVTFGDGTTFSPPTRLVFAKGTISREIDLPGAKRAIKKVEFKYGNLPGGGRARLELWAR